MCGRYTDANIQPDGLVSKEAMLGHPCTRERVWDRPFTHCLRWDFDPGLLEEAVSQLVGQPILVGGPPARPADEVVCFGIGLDLPFGTWNNCMQMLRAENKLIRLEVLNQLTRETATSLLHLLHHLGNGTYLATIRLPSFYIQHIDQHARQSVEIRDGTHLNPAIFTALRQARGGRRALEVYIDHRLERPIDTSIFAKVLGDELGFHSRP